MYLLQSSAALRRCDMTSFSSIGASEEQPGTNTSKKLRDKIKNVATKMAEGVLRAQVHSESGEVQAPRRVGARLACTWGTAGTWAVFSPFSRKALSLVSENHLSLPHRGAGTLLRLPSSCLPLPKWQMGRNPWGADRCFSMEFRILCLEMSQPAVLLNDQVPESLL